MENLILLCSGTKTMGGVKPAKMTSSYVDLQRRQKYK
jgi:hypothetical protein